MEILPCKAAQLPGRQKSRRGLPPLHTHTGLVMTGAQAVQWGHLAQSRPGWCCARVRRDPVRSWVGCSSSVSVASHQTVQLTYCSIGIIRILPASPLPSNPKILRHACGFALADQGADTRLIQVYLGHRNIQHAVRYTATNPARFEKLLRHDLPWLSIETLVLKTWRYVVPLRRAPELSTQL